MPTWEETEAAKTARGGWTKAQLALWGVPYPPPKGWRQRVIVASGNRPGPAYVPHSSLLSVFTDGACEPNPGAGGWAWVVDESTYDFGGVSDTTNNRMELYAVIEALMSVEKSLVIVSDSMYVVKCASGDWKRKINGDLWDSFAAVMDDRIKCGLVTQFQWVKGHAGTRLNEVADRLAEAGRIGDDLSRFKK